MPSFNVFLSDNSDSLSYRQLHTMLTPLLSAQLAEPQAVPFPAALPCVPHRSQGAAVPVLLFQLVSSIAVTGQWDEAFNSLLTVLDL